MAGQVPCWALRSRRLPCHCLIWAINGKVGTWCTKSQSGGQCCTRLRHRSCNNHLTTCTHSRMKSPNTLPARGAA